MTTIPAISVQELVRFLLARVDEDDAELRHRSRAKDAHPGEALPGTAVGSLDRQRAECDAKRRLIGHAQHLLVLRDLPAEKVVRDTAERMLRAMTMPYREHYGFRPEWDLSH